MSYDRGMYLRVVKRVGPDAGGMFQLYESIFELIDVHVKPVTTGTVFGTGRLGGIAESLFEVGLGAFADVYLMNDSGNQIGHWMFRPSVVKAGKPSVLN
jgi:hypothetical protein